MKKQGELYFLFFLIVLTIISCKAQNMDEKFDWSGKLSAPEEYPIEVVQGEISGEGYGQSFGHFGIHTPGWGSGGRTVGAGPDTKHLPDYLGITWISFAEKKVYSGQFTLPKDKILALFKKGFPDITDTSKTSTYNTFVVGLAPKGHISLWVGEGSGNQVEVATFKAEEAHIDTAKVLEEDKYMFTKKYVDYVLQDTMIVKPEIQEKIKQHGYPNPSIYLVDYRKKYNWQPRFVLPNGFKVKNWWAMMCNGEREYIPVGSNSLPLAERALPYFINLKFEDWHGNKYESFMVLTGDQGYLRKYFDDGDSKEIPLDFEGGEVEQLFGALPDKNSPIELIIEIDPQKKAVIISLEQGNIKKQIEKVHYHINNYGSEY
ncbi:DUF2931 family protein [Pedobacter sp. PLR]|uniref:DUF2931 family protein n=1 Tax=Pedobacter sp. PLR TaxID=2994465 RepID=UPI0022474752|nr:DUF2931 family protein [Pedobacter sp. PLR]MCX2451704.1 DUF2931 family protein [Pedobacter sp. PLR]